MSAIIFSVDIPGPKLLVHAEFNEGLLDTCLIYMGKCKPGQGPS